MSAGGAGAAAGGAYPGAAAGGAAAAGGCVDTLCEYMLIFLIGAPNNEAKTTSNSDQCTTSRQKTSFSASVGVGMGTTPRNAPRYSRAGHMPPLCPGGTVRARAARRGPPVWPGGPCWCLLPPAISPSTTALPLHARKGTYGPELTRTCYRAILQICRSSRVCTLYIVIAWCSRVVKG